MKPIPSPANRPMAIVALSLLLLIAAGLIFVTKPKKSESNRRTAFEEMLRKINRSAPIAKTESTPHQKSPDQPEMAAFNDFLMTFDPATGKVPGGRLNLALTALEREQQLKKSSSIQWSNHPSDMGGRTRTLLFDPNDASQKRVWAGAITGGLWYNNDITSPSSPWVPVSDLWGNLSVRCITFDPNNTQVFYIGTGEPETALQTYRESSGLGSGIMKSVDGGQTWNSLPSTSGFAYVTDIVVRTEGGQGVIYAGVASGRYKETNHQSQPTDGLYRSADGGLTWTQVLPDIIGSNVPYAVSDIALGTDNRLYVGSRPNLNGEGAATLLYSDDGLNWSTNDTYLTEIVNSSNNLPGRVVLANAPSNSNVVYALIASGYVNPSNYFNYYNCYHILRSADRGETWSKKNLPTDLTSGSNFATIAWHALIVAVDPNNADRIYAGGLDMHKSNDGGNTWTRVSDWSKMYSGGGPDYLHADQHAIAYKPGSSSVMVFGTDGGVFYTSGGTNIAPVFEEHNSGYSSLQFYTCALHPTAGTNVFYGGLQDNGSLYYTGDPVTINDMVSGGDGAFCFIDKDNPSLSITSIYYNQYYIFMNGNFLNAANNWSSGTFISPADFDYKNNSLFCNAVDYAGNYQDRILRLTNLTGNITGTYLNMGTGSTVYFSAVKYSQHAPSGKSTIFAGTQSGRLLRVNEAQSNAPVVTEITGSNFPAAYLSSIAVGGSEDTLMVTFSSYGVPSVFISFNGGTTWQNIENNLPDIPVRWAIFHPQSSRHALLATELGVWESGDLAQAGQPWTPVNSGLANVRVDMLQVRSADNSVLAATHGRGLFTATWDVVTTIGEQQGEPLLMFPNPTTGSLTLSGDYQKAGELEVLVYDASGRVAANLKRVKSPGPLRCNLSLDGKPSGCYTVSVKLNGTNVATQRIIKH